MGNTASELRRKAAMYRHAASVPTNGGNGTDRGLLILAEQLEHEAGVIEDVQRSIAASAPKAR
jgi:hypothetical protein